MYSAHDHRFRRTSWPRVALCGWNSDMTCVAILNVLAYRLILKVRGILLRQFLWQHGSGQNEFGNQFLVVEIRFVYVMGTCLSSKYSLHCLDHCLTLLRSP